MFPEVLNLDAQATTIISVFFKCCQVGVIAAKMCLYEGVEVDLCFGTVFYSSLTAILLSLADKILS